MEFKGLPGHSRILRERQQDMVDAFKARTIEEIMVKARQRITSMICGNDEAGDLAEEVGHFVDLENPNLTYEQRTSMIREILNELQGFGPIAELIEDRPDVSDVIVVNHRRILYRANGQVFTYMKNDRPVVFRSASHLRLLIERLVAMGNGRIDESMPFAVVHASGLRVTVAVPSVAVEPFVSIRKFIWVPQMEHLVETGFFSPEAAEFMIACSRGRRNLAFTGGMGTGKTTMLAVMARYWDEEELPILVESVRECPMEHPNLRILVGRSPNIEGKGEIRLDRLVQLALTSMATRVLVSEAKGGELFTILQSMNIGHDGSMFAAHANSSQDAVQKRFPAMLMQSPELSDGYNPTRLIAGSIHFICHLEENHAGQKYCQEIAEVDYQEGRCHVRPVFVRQDGALRATGYVPEQHLEVMQTRWNITVPRDVFRRPANWHLLEGGQGF